jgi:hypothetical protein
MQKRSLNNYCLSENVSGKNREDYCRRTFFAARNISCLRILFCLMLFVAICVWLQFSGQVSCSFGGELGSESGAERIEFFDAIKEGQIDVTLVQKNSLNAQVTIKNKTKKTLLFELPRTFAGVPYNAQETGLTVPPTTPTTPSATTGSTTTSTTNNNANQTTGGGMGGYGGGMGGYGGGMGGYGGGMYSLPPEKVVTQNLKTICLEYGKKEPRESVKYTMRPLEYATDKPEVREICARIAAGTVDQWAAQAAIWHHNNNMSWDLIASKRVKPRIDSMYSVPLFSPQQIAYAINLSRQIEQTVAHEKLQPKKLKPQIFKPNNDNPSESIITDTGY